MRRSQAVRSRRKAAKLYLQGVKLLQKKRPEDAWKLLKQAVELEPDNATYEKAAELARQSAVTQLVEEAGRATAESESAGVTLATSPEAGKLLQHAQEIDPKNPMVIEHLQQMGDKEAAAGAAIRVTPSAAAGDEGCDHVAATLGPSDPPALSRRQIRRR